MAQVVPDHQCLVIIGSAIVVWFAVFMWLRKTSKQSVAEG